MVTWRGLGHEVISNATSSIGTVYFRTDSDYEKTNGSARAAGSKRTCLRLLLICRHLFVDDENLDPKTWCRFPILSGGFREELGELNQD